MTLNVDVDLGWEPGYPLPHEAQRLGARVMRMVSLPQNEYVAGQYLRAGMRVIGVYTGESDAADRYVMRNVTALQIGNEPGFVFQGAASWPTGTTEDFINVWHHVAEVLVPAAHPNGLALMGPGIWMHDFSKWAEIAPHLRGLSAAAVHCYDHPTKGVLTAARTRYYLSRFRNVLPSVPLWCTEYTVRGDEFMPVLTAILDYCVEAIWAHYGPGVPGHTLVGSPEFGKLVLA